MDFRRTCVTVPSNVVSGHASKRQIAFWPSAMRPMSASSTLASICIRVRSRAMEKSVGVWRLAATVCPTSTFRAMTTPSTGETMRA